MIIIRRRNVSIPTRLFSPFLTSFFSLFYLLFLQILLSTTLFAISSSSSSAISSTSAVYDPSFDRINPPVNPAKFQTYLAICAVVKNEMDVREWIVYHMKLGVGKFYLRDNGNIPVSDQITDFINLGIVEVQILEKKAPQLMVYHRCIRNYRLNHQWIAFIDADEFIVSPKNCSIPSLLKHYEDYGGLTLNWIVFGSSGLLKRPSKGGVLSNYYRCYPYEHVKTIVNTNYAVSHYGNPHIFHYSHGKFAVDTNFFKVETPVNLPKDSLYEILYINHYHLKSKEDYDRNRKRGRASTLEPTHKTEEYFHRINANCDRNCSFLVMPKQKFKDCPRESFTKKPINFE